MPTKTAVLKVLKDNPGMSKYRLALDIGVRPIMINHYIKYDKPSKMSKTTAERFKAIFDIEISDVYNPLGKRE